MVMTTKGRFNTLGVVMELEWPNLLLNFSPYKSLWSLKHNLLKED